MLTDDEARTVTRSYTNALRATAAHERAWREHHRVIAAIYERGRRRSEPVTEQDIADRCDVTRQSVSRWVQRGRPAA